MSEDGLARHAIRIAAAYCRQVCRNRSLLLPVALLLVQNLHCRPWCYYGCPWEERPMYYPTNCHSYCVTLLPPGVVRQLVLTTPVFHDAQCTRLVCPMALLHIGAANEQLHMPATISKSYHLQTQRQASRQLLEPIPAQDRIAASTMLPAAVTHAACVAQATTIIV